MTVKSRTFTDGDNVSMMSSDVSLARAQQSWLSLKRMRVRIIDLRPTDNDFACLAWKPNHIKRMHVSEDIHCCVGKIIGAEQRNKRKSIRPRRLPKLGLWVIDFRLFRLRRQPTRLILRLRCPARSILNGPAGSARVAEGLCPIIVGTLISIWLNR